MKLYEQVTQEIRALLPEARATLARRLLRRGR